MKKIISIMISAVMILLIPLAAFADFERSSYDYYADFPIKVICGNFTTSANREETATANFAIKDTSVYSSFKLDLIFEENVISYSGSTISVDLYKKYTFRLELKKHNGAKVEYVGYFMFVVDDGIVYCNIDYNLLDNSTRSYISEVESNNNLYVLQASGGLVQNVVNPNIKNITKTDVGSGTVSAGDYDYWKLTAEFNNKTIINANIIIQTDDDSVIYYWLYRKPVGLIGPGAETLVSQSHFTVSGTMTYGINFITNENGTEYEYYIKIGTGDGYTHSYTLDFVVNMNSVFFSQYRYNIGTGYNINRISSLKAMYNGILGTKSFYDGSNSMMSTGCYITSCAILLRNLEKTTTKYDYRIPESYESGPTTMLADPYSVTLANSLSNGQVGVQNGVEYFTSYIDDPTYVKGGNIARGFNASFVAVGDPYRAATRAEKIQMLADALAANPEGVIIQYPSPHYVVLIGDNGSHIEDPNDRFIIIDPGATAYVNGYRIPMGQNSSLVFENANAYIYFN